MLLQRHLKNFRSETKIFQRRLLAATFIVAALIGALLLRLAYLQIFEHKYYHQLATQNQLEMFAIEPNRGLIYDRNGVLLVANTPTFTLAIIPDYVVNTNDTISELSKIIDLNKSHIRQFYKALKQHKKFAHIPLKYKLTQNEVEIFYANQFRFPGVVIDAAMMRRYPFGEITANIIGYVGKINPQDLKNIKTKNYTVNSLIGKIGIEKYYEENLRGETGLQKTEIDATGHIVRNLTTINPIPGNNLYLTIDSNLQIAAQKALGDERGAVVAIDPNNGEILALVSNPSYDPNLFAYGIDAASFQQLQNSPYKPMYNRAVRGLFPLASTIKPFIALAALDTNTIDTKYTITDPGWFKLPNIKHLYRDWQPHGHGKVNITKAIAVSCDVFFYMLAVKLGIEKIDSVLMRFGFGQKTGIDLGEELNGVVASPKWKTTNTGKPWYPGDTVLSGIGQGFMLATPLQLANATTIIANRGIRYQPHLLLKKQIADNKIIEQPPSELRPIVLKNKRNWNTVINAMANVVSHPSGTAYTSFRTNAQYTIAGKTGTAQLFRHRFNEENATFETANIPKKLRNHSLFIGFAPIDKPRITISVVVENSVTAPTIARKVLDYYFAPNATPPPISTKPAPPKPMQKVDETQSSASPNQDSEQQNNEQKNNEQ